MKILKKIMLSILITGSASLVAFGFGMDDPRYAAMENQANAELQEMPSFLPYNDVPSPRSAPQRGWQDSTELVEAAKRGDIETVIKLIESVPVENRAEYIIFRDSNGNSAAEYALENGHKAVADVLIKYLSACNGGYERSRGISIYSDRLGSAHLPAHKYVWEDLTTPLFEAAKRGDIETVIKLIESVPVENRAEYIIFRDSNGNSATEYALENGHKAVADVLIKYLLAYDATNG